MSDRTTKDNPAASNPPAVAERRTDQRYSFTAAIEAFDPITKLRVKGRTSDLSRGGCYVDTISPFGIGTSIKVRITRENKTFDVEGRVVYSQASMGMGIAFVALLPAQSGMIDRWIGEATGEITESSDTGFGSPEQSEDATTKLKEEQQYVLNDLIIALMRKGSLTESEGKIMLARLHR
jgi:hypothetical protein